LLGSALLLKHHEQDGEPRQNTPGSAFAQLAPHKPGQPPHNSVAAEKEEGSHHGPRQEGDRKKQEPKLSKSR